MSHILPQPHFTPAYPKLLEQYIQPRLKNFLQWEPFFKKVPFSSKIPMKTHKVATDKVKIIRIITEVVYMKVFR